MHPGKNSIISGLQVSPGGPQGEPKPLLGHKIYIFGDTGNYKNGFFIGRRCEKLWVRLSSNLLIEQGLMRSGALTIKGARMRKNFLTVRNEKKNFLSEILTEK